MIDSNMSYKKKVEYDILYKSLIGQEVEVVESSNKNYIGFKGILVHESANLFHIDVLGEVKKVLKKDVIIRLKYDGRFLRVNGFILQGSLLSRIKKMK
jgi:RNase P/RNase MRP subunit p29